jgi:hypothetical protein
MKLVMLENIVLTEASESGEQDVYSGVSVIQSGG